MFKAIEKKTVPEQVVSYILDSISNNIFKDDDKLPSERALSEVLMVSRSSLREGLRILELMNVIEKRSGGTFVKINNNNVIKEAIDIGFALQSINYYELIEVRNLLEVKSASLAAKNATINDIENLSKLCKTMERSLDIIKDYAIADTEFHIAIAESTQNDILYQIFETIKDIMYDYQKYNMVTKDDVLRSYTEHIEIFNALKDGDVQKTEELMKRHLEYTQGLYEEKN